MEIPGEFCLTGGMTHWEAFTAENVKQVPESILGVFQLSKDGDTIQYVGRADDNLRDRMVEMLGKGYTHFQWVHLPWTKETFEMHCRLHHSGGGTKLLENLDHPYPPEGKLWRCPVSSETPSMCSL